MKKLAPGNASITSSKSKEVTGKNDARLYCSKNEPLWPPLTKRKSGVLLHPTSLPSDQGIGSLGYQARAFIDFLAEAGFSYWQVCPLGPTGFGDSPYQTFSAFAGNPYLIDLDYLQSLDLVHWQHLEGLKKLSKDHVDFGALYTQFWHVLKTAFAQFLQNPKGMKEENFIVFEKENAFWLNSYAAFRALKEHFKGAPWWEWPKELQSFKKASKTSILKDLSKEIFEWKLYEYLFNFQWKNLKAYANSKNIQIIGDAPIFVSADSADVWAFPEIFDLDKNGAPASQAGVPPDYFSKDGQLWGNPLYNWDSLKATQYEWWVQRLERNFEWFDTIRLDHFRGFESYWRIDTKAKTARNGEWAPGPGIDFFQTIKKHFPNASLIAEDLGDITPSVRAMHEKTGLPGMAILQFAFGGDSKNIYLPHNQKQNQVIYPGTHDNDTTLGWYTNAPENVKDHVRRYLRINGNEIAWDFIRSSLASPAQLAIIQMQDLMSLGSAARMNLPGKPNGNWSWRYTTAQFEQLKKNSKDYLKSINELYGRC